MSNLLDSINNKIRNKYPDITIIKYTGSKSDCEILGNCGHSWTANYNSISGGKGGYTCRICTPRKPNITAKKWSLDEANVKLHAKYPNLTFITYSGSNSDADILGDCGHIWRNRPRNVLYGHSGYTCRICTPAINSRITLKSANLQLFDKFPDLEFITFHGLQAMSTIKSLTCGHTWETTLNNISNYNTPATCPICFPRVQKTSKGEKEIVEYIKTIYSGWVVENDRSLIEPYELDIVIPDKNLAIEYNGNYFHSSKFDRAISMLDKSKKLDFMQLIHVSDEEWNTKKDIVKSRISSILGVSQFKIYARKCIVREIPFPREFLNSNHIQGIGSPTSINLGLFYKNNLISVMTFSSARFTDKYEYELVRFCSVVFHSVVGGASKLFKYFVKNYSPKSVISYSDKRWSLGKLYQTLGFEYEHTSAPNYRYIKSGAQSLSRYACQKHLLKSRFPEYYDDKLTEQEIMELAGYYRVYDCGSDVWSFRPHNYNIRA